MLQKKTPLFFLVAILVLCLSTKSYSATIRVKLDSTNDGPGNDWDHAYHTITAGLAAATAGDEIWVAKGTYSKITLKLGVGLYGGFAGNETDRSQRDITNNETIIDAYGVGKTVVSPTGATTTTIIDGFTIKNAGKSGYCGGVYCSSSSPMIANNTITSNFIAGIYCTSSSPTITNNIIKNNAQRTDGGYGIYCDSSSAPLVINNTIISNPLSGIWCANSSLTASGNYIACNADGISSRGNGSITISNNKVVGNRSIGIKCGQTSNTIVNNMIWRNGSSGISVVSSPTSIITSNTIVANTGRYGAINCGYSSLVISNNIVAYNASGIYNSSLEVISKYNDVFGNAAYNYSGISVGEGDISVDPKLVSLDYDDLHILSDSACRNAGWNDDPNLLLSDMDGQARIQNEVVDIGADESDGSNPPSGPYIIVRVSSSGDDNNDGLNWSSTKKTIQGAINAAALTLGGEVWVKAGTYVEQVTVPAHVNLYGGFAGTESARSERNWASNKTVIDGGGTMNVVTFNNDCSSSTLDGFIVQNGKQDVNTRRGGGIYCTYSSPKILNSTIVRNDGLGIDCDYSAPSIINNMIVSNANGVSCGDSLIIANNTIAANGSGLKCNSSQIYNNIVAFNGCGIYTTVTYPTLRNNDVYGNHDYDYWQQSPGVGDISVDPRFINWKYGNFHLLPDSPCVNAGMSEYQLPDQDIDSQTRVQDGAIDIGADESDGTGSALPIAIIRVAMDGNDSNDGSDWASAKKTIQGAIDSISTIGGEVWVKAGTYDEYITIPPYVFLYGGFAGTENLKSERDWTTNKSIIDAGEHTGNIVTVKTAYMCGCLDGFTIRGDEALYAILCSLNSMEITNNEITSNYGYGIDCSYSYSPITSNRIINNGKGGIYCSFSTLIISGNVISSTLNGSGIYVNSASPTITNNMITGNTTTGNGGGIYLQTAEYNTVVSNNLIAKNQANSGGGIYFSSDPIRALTGNTIVDNTGEGLYIAKRYLPVSNNIIAFNSLGIYAGTYGGTPANAILANNDVYNPSGSNYVGLSAGTSDFSLDPMFVNRAGEDYHLTSTSPCIDKGWNGATGIGNLDMDSQIRINGIVDIGIDEFWNPQLASKVSSDGASVSVSSFVVTAVFPDYFYIESDDRTVGIRVNKVGHNMLENMRVYVSGVVRTNTDGERYIDASTAYRCNPPDDSGSISCLGIGDRWVGGGDWLYDESSGAGQKGITDAFGVNNIGLLITTWGKVVEIEQVTPPAMPTWFKIDDGSGVSVKCVVPDGVIINSNWQTVSVTGISSCEKVGQELHRLVRVRMQDDIISY